MTTRSRILGCGLAAAACLFSAKTAFAHAGHLSPHDNPWVSGMLHPLMGMDHLLAMLASGLLAVRLATGRALWVIPLSFVGLMIGGGVLAAAGAPLHQAEWGIAVSVIVLGLIVAVMPNVPLGAAVTLIGLFAVCHGHAHVAEAGSAALLPYMAGFAVATLVLHAAAITFGLAAQRVRRPHLVRFAGAGIVVGFMALLLMG